MKASIIKLAIVAIASMSFVANSTIISAAPAPQDAAVQKDEGMVFNWKNAPWPDVIEWFADQAGFVVDAAAQYPEGTFTFKSDRPLSPVESIDEINHKLGLSDPPKTLVRNRNVLYLVDADVVLPGALVETIGVTDLNSRGKYETLQVKFDISGLDSKEIEEEVSQRISSHNEDFFQMFPSTNEMFVRESGENLRFIRDIVDRAKMSSTPTYSIMNLTHISAELFVERISTFHPLNEDNRTDDGSLIIQIDSTPGSQRLIIRGTPEKIKDIELLASISDVETDEIAVSADDPLRTKRYPVTRDAQETFDIIDRLLFEEGGGARVIQGAETGTITVRGRNRDHEIVAEYLALLTKNSGGFTSVDLENGNATDIAADTQVVLGITSENLAESVRLLPMDDRDVIIVKGTPIQVTEAVQVIEELDRKAAPMEDALRTKRRVISMAPGDRDRVMSALPDVWPTMGRDNPFEIRPPKASAEKGSLFRKREKQMEPWMEEMKKEFMKDQGSMLRKRAFEFAVLASPSIAMNLSQSFLQSPDEPSPGDKMNEEMYQLPKQIQSKPGAPVRIWATEYGIIIESDDLDAGDDAAYLIDQLLGEESEQVKPQIYQLKHVEASYMKALLESIFGLSSGGGGGGGGGLLTGMADNIMGEAAGGMVDSLFGGSGGASAASTLEGDVTFGIDGRLNYMWVIGATASDLASIDSMIDIYDVSSPPHNPETAGQLYEIIVKHRDPMELKETIESLMGQYFEDETEGQQGGGGGNQAAQMMQAMRQAMGQGNGSGGGSSEIEEMKPTGSLEVDMKTGKLFFLGPEFIFLQIQTFVTAVDVPDVKEELRMLQLKVEDPEGMVQLLKNLLGEDKFEVIPKGDGGEESAETAEGTAAAGGANGNAKAGAAQAQQAQQAAQAQARAAAIQAFQRANRGGGGGGRGAGGGGRGGGGGGGRGGGGGGRGGR